MPIGPQREPDHDALEAAAKEAQAEWTRQQQTGRRNSAAYQRAYKQSRVTSRALLAAKLNRPVQK